MAVGNGLRVFLWIHGGRDRSMDALPVPRSHPDLSVCRKAGLQPNDRSGRRGHQAHARSERVRTRLTVLALLRARWDALAAPAEAGMDREVQRQVRHGL